MVMQANYQPVVIRKLLLDGESTRDEIEKELEKYNPGIESKSMTTTVLRVLRKERNKVIRKEGKKFVIDSSETFSKEQTKELIELCSKKINDFNALHHVVSTNESKIWIYSVDSENWEVVKKHYIWASKADLKKISEKVHQNDYVIFFVKGTLEFRGPTITKLP